MRNEIFTSQLSTYFKRQWDFGAGRRRARGLSDCVEGSWSD
jgi:hypothetical protein